ncbi:hypothetical protein CEF21_00215 [Bacillus sp. FJAT-42376]|uniref:hypothetical protein n=1 Tax=Bacillus sp. FJAT-42376 TaxID=2014076 RepID=UPI000F4F8F82|nr:hypothetical protein [Bacillus sp. FJAT-42376]AZB40894.1 hypothetical protein CEF21_00215 [Bacillus sp. FJAT-42376]
MAVWIISLIAGLFLLRMIVRFIWSGTITFHVNRIKEDPNEERSAIFLKKMKMVWSVPNKPHLWIGLKEAYFVILNSRHIDFETKLSIYQLLTKRRVYGLRKPYKRLHSKAIAEPSA